MNTLIGQKKEQSQRFLESGKRIPVTLVDVKDNTVVSLKTNEKDNYQAIQIGFGMKKNATKAEKGHASKGAKLEKAPKFLKEVRVIDASETLPEVGAVLKPQEVFEPGDMVDVSGFSKGKGFQGGVKRYGFHGGPKTHGQSDRHRAPGSIGQGTTPGRVYKGKRMAGNMGNENVTVKNLEIIDVTADGVLIIKGLVPGIINGPLMVVKTGTDKNFVPLYKSPEEKKAEDKSADAVFAKDADGSKVEATEETSDELKEETKKEKVESTDEVKTEEDATNEPKEEKNEAEQKADDKSEDEATVEASAKDSEKSEGKKEEESEVKEEKDDDK